MNLRVKTTLDGLGSNLTALRHNINAAAGSPKSNSAL